MINNTRRLDFVAKFDGTIEDNLREFGFSSMLIVKLKKKMGLVTVNGEAKPLIAPIIAGDDISVLLIDEPKPRPIYKHDINIVYEDDDLAIIDKTPDVAVIETMPHYGKSLSNILEGIWGDFVYRPINRLDRQTSGLMAVAKNGFVHSMFSTKKTTMIREYYAIVEGICDREGVIDAPIDKVGDDTVRRMVKEGGKPAITRYTTIETYDNKSLLRIRLETGRTHQIRVHMAHIGHPLLGDDMYGGSTELIDRHALHSCYMEFVHPITGEKKRFSSRMPYDMEMLIRDKE